MDLATIASQLGTEEQLETLIPIEDQINETEFYLSQLRSYVANQSVSTVDDSLGSRQQSTQPKVVTRRGKSVPTPEYQNWRHQLQTPADTSQSWDQARGAHQSTINFTNTQIETSAFEPLYSEAELSYRGPYAPPQPRSRLPNSSPVNTRSLRQEAATSHTRNQLRPAYNPQEGELSHLLPAVSKDIKLPKFNGDAKEFNDFMELFEILVGRSSIPTLYKAVLLKEALSGAALDSVKYIKPRPENFNLIKQLLYESFGQENMAEEPHLKKLDFTLSSGGAIQYDKLFPFASSISRHILALIELGHTYVPIPLSVHIQNNRQTNISNSTQS